MTQNKKIKQANEGQLKEVRKDHTKAKDNEEENVSKASVDPLAYDPPHFVAIARGNLWFVVESSGLSGTVTRVGHY